MQYFRENKSQRAISRDLKMSRSTVAKYINEFKSKLELLEDLDKDEEKDRSKMLLLIEEMTSKPKYDTSSRTRTKLTDEIIDKINELLEQNEKNRLLGRTKQLMKRLIYMKS